MHVLIAGGSKSGKSMRAQSLAISISEELHVPHYYIAVMIPQDDEDRRRVADHRKARLGWGFQTIEEPLDIRRISEYPDVNMNGVFLLDSVTALLVNMMFRDGTFHEDAGEQLMEQLTAWTEMSAHTIFVTDTIDSDAMRYDEMTEAYRKALASIGTGLSKICPQVEEVSAGISTCWKANVDKE
jgi:adenosylcobinamide kinase/adenosylcobinamide-phosphate guanylyltransferase